MMADTMLDIVDENDEIIGQALRSQVHKQGLRHREINVWFITPNKEIIFQKRLPKPPSYPLPILDATAGGHVELGASYLETALQEISEETGVMLNEGDLHLFKNTKIDESFPGLGTINNVFRSIYAYNFLGKASNLKIEEGKGQGFIVVPVSELLNGAKELEKEFFIIPYLVGPEMMSFYKGILNG